VTAGRVVGIVVATRLKRLRLKNESAGMSVQSGLITCWNIGIDRDEGSELID